MNLNCQNILKMTEAQLRYKSDVSLQEATPQELHEALSQAVMMSISENWTKSKRSRIQGRKAHYFSAEYLIGRLVYSNLYNLGILDEMKKTLRSRRAWTWPVHGGHRGRCSGQRRPGPSGRLLPGQRRHLRICRCPAMACATASACSSSALTTTAARRRTADDWTKFGDPWSLPPRTSHTVKVHFADQTVLAVPV